MNMRLIYAALIYLTAGFPFVLLSNSPSFAQEEENTCITQRQYLNNQFGRDAEVCDENLALPMKYCLATNLTIDDRLQIHREADYGHLLLSEHIIADSDLIDEMFNTPKARFFGADSARTQVLTDHVSAEWATHLFYFLYTGIAYKLVDEMAVGGGDPESVDLLGFDNLFELVRKYELGTFYLYGMPKTIPDLKTHALCAVRCGSEAIDMRRLTRSKVFDECVKINGGQAIDYP